MSKKTGLRVTGAILFFAFIVVSYVFNLKAGKEIGRSFTSFSFGMLKILPCAFILIGLFEVWIKRETVEKHFGEKSGIKGYIWSILLAGTTVGGLYVAFPLACSLYKKGASLSVVFTYVGASAICRIPMTIFEASFLGIKFSVIRFMVSLPLIIISSISLAKWLKKQGYHIVDKEKYSKI